jgi:hypothetical protein
MQKSLILYPEIKAYYYTHKIPCGYFCEEMFYPLDRLTNNKCYSIWFKDKKLVSFHCQADYLRFLSWMEYLISLLDENVNLPSETLLKHVISQNNWSYMDFCIVTYLRYAIWPENKKYPSTSDIALMLELAQRHYNKNFQLAVFKKMLTQYRRLQRNKDEKDVGFHEDFYLDLSCLFVYQESLSSFITF